MGRRARPKPCASTTFARSTIRRAATDPGGDGQSPGSAQLAPHAGSVIIAARAKRTRLSVLVPVPRVEVVAAAQPDPARLRPAPTRADHLVAARHPVVGVAVPAVEAVDPEVAR